MKIIIWPNYQKNNIQPSLNLITKYLNEKNIETIFSSDNQNSSIKQFIQREEVKKAELIIALGGDGTFLNAGHIAAELDLPLWGVNFGRLGFLTDVHFQEIFQYIEKIINRDYIIENRNMISFQSEHHKNILLNKAINDIVIDKGEGSRPIHIELWIDGKWVVSFDADGIIFSTPTGSTAYSLSAGGPILPPYTPAIIAAPICPHILALRPTVFSDNSIITLKVHSPIGHSYLSIDGQFRYTIGNSSEITIRKEAKPIKLIRTKSFDFFQVLRDKLHWGKSIREKHH